MVGVRFKPKPSRKAFRYGDGVFPSLGTIPIIIPTPDGSFTHFDIDIVKPSVPMLIGLDILDLFSLVPDNVENELVNRKQNWKMPIIMKTVHLFFEWDLSETLYTNTELKRIHFYHPSAKKLFQVISIGKPKEATSETKRMIEQISKACATCQIFTPKPQTFQVRVPGGIVFNQECGIKTQRRVLITRT